MMPFSNNKAILNYKFTSRQTVAVNWIYMCLLFEEFGENPSHPLIFVFSTYL